MAQHILPTKRKSKALKNFLENRDCISYQTNACEINKYEFEKFTWFTSSSNKFPNDLTEHVGESKYNTFCYSGKIPENLEKQVLSYGKNYVHTCIISQYHPDSANSALAFKNSVIYYDRLIDIIFAMQKDLKICQKTKEHYYYYYLNFIPTKIHEGAKDFQIINVMSPYPGYLNKYSSLETTQKELAEYLQTVATKGQPHLKEGTNLDDFLQVVQNPNLDIKNALQSTYYILFPYILDNPALPLYLLETPNEYLKILMDILQKKKELNLNLFAKEEH